MRKATDALLADHRMITKLLENFQPDNPRWPIVSDTLRRVVLSHAWFEDAIFLPVVRLDRRFVSNYLDGIERDHRDLDVLLRLALAPEGRDADTRWAHVQQFRALLTTHLRKEEDALFPLAEKYVSEEGLTSMAADMERRRAESLAILD